MTSETKKRRHKAKDDDASVKLLKAVGEWVKSKGGEVLVAGGISIQSWPGEGDFNFHVAVKCTGRRPASPESEG